MITLASQYRFNERFLGLLTGDFDAAAWDFRPAGTEGNTAHWLAGHLLATRWWLLERLGIKTPAEPWHAEFGKGARPGAALGGPAPVELVDRFGGAGEQLEARLTAMDDAAFAAAWGKRIPNGGTTVLDALRFYHFHESYHLGQIGLLRRQMGKSGIV